MLMTPNLVQALRLMLVTDDVLLAGRDLVALARTAEAAGVTSVQVRLKQATARDVVAVTRALIAALGIPVFVNDRPDIALAAGAAGVHLGEDDLPVAAVRRLAPPGFLIGASVGAPHEAARGAGADYWGVGPYHGTATKHDAGAAIGARGVQLVTGIVGAPPGVAIGGVTPADAAAIRAAGAAGMAVVSGLLRADDIAVAAHAYVAAWGVDHG